MRDGAWRPSDAACAGGVKTEVGLYRLTEVYNMRAVRGLAWVYGQGLERAVETPTWRVGQDADDADHAATRAVFYDG